MPKTVMVSAQIDPKLKDNVERVFKKLGLTATQAIVLFYKQVDSQNRLPFEVKRPNAITKKALADARARRNLESFDSTDSLFKSLGI